MKAYDRESPYLYRGIVESNVDPKNLGRCKVRVPSIHGELNYSIDILPWARPLVFSPVNRGKGTVNIPDKGDIVWVLFEGADRGCPVYFGGSYALEDMDIDSDVVSFYIEGEDKISYHRKYRSYIVKVGNSTLEVSPEGVTIIGDTKITGNVTISGRLTVNDLFINGTCNKECDCT